MLPMFSGDPAKVSAFAQRAQELGYDGLFAFDHFFPPGTSAARPALEVFTTLSAVTIACPGMTVGTLVARAGVRAPGMLAKMAAQVDDMSGGRSVLGLGAGDAKSRAETETFGLPFLATQDERYALMRETALAVGALLRGDGYPGGERVPPLAGPLLPPPVRPGGPPIWIGGTGVGAVRAAAAVADGWNGWGLDLQRFAERAALLAGEAIMNDRPCDATWGGIVLVGEDRERQLALQDQRREHGLSDLGVWAGTTEEFSAFLDGLEGAGSTWAIFVPAGGADRLELIADAALQGAR